MISIIIPVLNEEKVLEELYRQIWNVMELAHVPFEIIFVDDGSSDKSLEVMLKLFQKQKNVKVVELSRNFGQQAAITAGLEYARGDAVVTMDSDLQHPPELIPQLVSKWKEGYDVVYTRRERTVRPSLLKKITSSLFYRIVNRMSAINIPGGAADFRLMDRKVVEAFRRLEERTLFLRGLVSWVGYRQVAVPYEAKARYSGDSKYSLIRMLRFAADGITSFSSVPLYISAFIGMIISTLGFAYAAFAIYARLFTNYVVEGWTSVIVVVLFLGGIQMIGIGIQGIYLGRIYNEVKGRPRYLVRNVYGLGERDR